MFAAGLLLTAALVILGFYTAGKDAPPQEPQADSASLSPAARRELLQCRFYDEAQFDAHRAAAAQAAAEMQLQSRTQAAILPHHLTAGAYIAAFFAALAPEDYDTVVLLAPNHGGKGGNFLYSLGDWETPFGVLPCDRELTEALMYDDTIRGKRNDAYMQEDHAIAALIPYLAAALPETRTVSVLIAGNTPVRQINRLVSLLAQRQERILLLCSTDFSHYLQTRDALRMDEISMEAIGSADTARIAAFDNDYSDSPPCLLAFLGYAEERGLAYSLAWHGSSAELAGYSPDAYIEGGITTYQIWQACAE